MRLIDADELIRIFTRDEYDRVKNEYQLGFNDGLLHAVVVADDQPTVDAVPVIRCQDCKYCDAMTIFGKTTLYSCTRKNPAVDVLPSDYCSRGRRKDERT